MTSLAPRRIFRNRNRPRSSIDIRVGNNHLVETVLQLRRADWEWYIENESEIEHELLELLEESIIPRMFGREIEEQPHKQKGSSTEKQQQQQQQVGSKNTTRGGKKKKKTAKSTKKASLSKIIDEHEEKPEKDVYFSFGELIQLAYRRENLLSKSGYMTQHTLFYKEEEEEENTGDEQKGESITSSFDYFPKLSHRLLIWISKIDPQNKTNPDPPGVGFYRPELIPISDLFRQPKGVVDPDDFSEDEDNK